MLAFVLQMPYYGLVKAITPNEPNVPEWYGSANLHNSSFWNAQALSADPFLKQILQKHGCVCMMVRLCGKLIKKMKLPSVTFL